MKKILASIVALTAVTGFASVAHAGGTNAPSGSTGAATFTSVNTGSVSGTCSLAVTNGILPTNQGFVSSLTATTPGTISTVCNSTTSTIKVALATGTSPTQTNYTEEYTLTGGTGAYLAVPTIARGAVPGNDPYDQTDLSNGFSTTPSTLNITAKGAVPTTQLLAAGTYVINVDVTVTP